MAVRSGKALSFNTSYNEHILWASVIQIDVIFCCCCCCCHRHVLANGFLLFVLLSVRCGAFFLSFVSVSLTDEFPDQIFVRWIDRRPPHIIMKTLLIKSLYKSLDDGSLIISFHLHLNPTPHTTSMRSDIIAKQKPPHKVNCAAECNRTIVARLINEWKLISGIAGGKAAACSALRNICRM